LQIILSVWQAFAKELVEKAVIEERPCKEEQKRTAGPWEPSRCKEGSTIEHLDSMDTLAIGVELPSFVLLTVLSSISAGCHEAVILNLASTVLARSVISFRSRRSIFIDIFARLG
jgi:hypothetical protein